MSRKLLNRSHENLGIDQKIWIVQETGGYGDDATGGLVPTGAGALEHITCNLDFDIPREPSASRSGRSVVRQLSGKKTAGWTFEGYIIPGIPNGANEPQLPPAHLIILSAFGLVDLSDPTEIVYSFSRLNDKTFRILEEASHYSRLEVGCVADNLTFTLAGDGKSMMKADGFGQDVYAAGESVLAQATTGVAVAASLVKADLTFTADTVGSAGNGISIDYTTGGTAGSELVTVTGLAIVVQIETGVSTATQVKAALDGFPAAAALINTVITGTGSNAQSAAGAAAFLSGGLGATELKVAAGLGVLIEVGSYIDIIDKDDGDTVKLSAALVTAVGTGQNADVITVGVTVPAADVDDIVIGHAPSTFAPVSSENALLGLKGTFTLNGSSPDCEMIGCEISIKNNFTKRDFHFGTSKICGYLPDKRRNVGVKAEFLFHKDNFNKYVYAKSFIAQGMSVTLAPQDIPAPSFSTGLGRSFTFDMPRVEFKVPKLEQPADGYVKLSLEGIAMAVDEDNLDTELTLTIA